MDKYKKIEVIYPDGRRDCQENVTETYRAAIEYIGLEKVRGLGIMFNSINIVSTRDEMKSPIQRFTTSILLQSHRLKRASIK